jgi:hypothetical protein
LQKLVKKTEGILAVKNPLSKLFQKNSQFDVESELNHKKIGKMYEAKFLTPSPQIFRLLLDPIVLKI